MLKLIKLKSDDKLNFVNKIYDFRTPTNIYIPIYHNVTFKMNDYFEKNTYIGDALTSISGYLKGSKNVLIKNRKIQAIKIENDYKENGKQKIKRAKINNKEDLIKVLDDYNLNNLSQKILEIKNIKQVVVSSIDEEIYVIKEFIRLANNYSEIIETMDTLLTILNVGKGVLVIKNTNFKNIKNVKSIIGTYPNIKINLLPDKYLISHKPFLCQYLNYNSKETLVLTTNEIYSIYNILKKGKEITEQLITISGDVIEKSIAINVKLYTSLEEIIKEYIEIIDDDYEIFINGYLTGEKVDNQSEIIITKDIDSIILKKRILEKETECINCGACQKICPFNINVKDSYYKKELHKDCISCGLCEFICPAKIKLKKLMRGINYEE